MSESVMDPKLGILVDERYRVDECVATGGMGVVYKAERVGMGKTVAIKFLQETFAAMPDLIRRFEREAAVMSRLAHPNIVSVIDYGVLSGTPYLVMEFCAGTALSTILSQGPIPAQRAVPIALQILAALEHLHGAGIVHRDVKPDNVLILSDVPGDFVKILDFGLAKQVDNELLPMGKEVSQLTQAGFALGTPSYMSPEQAQGSPVDLRTDIYSLGVVFYVMLVGRKPFVSDTPLGVLRMHMEVPPLPPRKAMSESVCSEELERVILRAMEKRPEARFQSAAEFVAALVRTPEGGGMIGATLAATLPPTLPAPPSNPVVEELDLGATAFELPPSRTLAARRPQHRTSWATLLLGLGLGAAVAWAWIVGGKPNPSSTETQIARSGRPTPPPEEPSQVQNGAPPVAPAPLSGPATAATEGEDGGSPSGEGAAASAQAESGDGGAQAAAEDADEPEQDPTQIEDTPGITLEKEAEQEQARAAPDAGQATPAGRPAPPKPTIGLAERLLDHGEPDAAVQALYSIRRRAPKNAYVALLLGHAYFHKLWRTDGLREYANAVSWNPKLKYNRALQRNLIVALDNPTYGLARGVIKKWIGKSALSELRRAVKSNRNPTVRVRAGRLIGQLENRRSGWW